MKIGSSAATSKSNIASTKKTETNHPSKPSVCCSFPHTKNSPDPIIKETNPIWPILPFSSTPCYSIQTNVKKNSSLGFQGPKWKIGLRRVKTRFVKVSVAKKRAGITTVYIMFTNFSCTVTERTLTKSLLNFNKNIFSWKEKNVQMRIIS